MVKPHQEVVMGKAKLNKKLTSLILILALVATIITTSVYGNLLVSRSTNGVAIPRGCNVPSFYLKNIYWLIFFKNLLLESESFLIL